jgi:hypothetical protein
MSAVKAVIDAKSLMFRKLDRVIMKIELLLGVRPFGNGIDVLEPVNIVE